MNELNERFAAALARRSELLAQLAAENTDCYRLFHGTNEGLPGLTVDRYGPLLLIQSFHAPIGPDDCRRIESLVAEVFTPAETVYADRSSKLSAPASASEGYIGSEIGVKYRVRGRHAGQDPLLFLDMRAGRRRVLELAAGKSVLNLFAYTCGLGVCAALAGASEVWNVDFAQRSLEIGRENAALNRIDPATFRLIKSDFFTVARQLAGLPIQGRRGQKTRDYLKLEPRAFDLVCLDPPRWAKSPFGTVDLIRDYPSVLKPAVLATKSGGSLLCANNVASVDLDAWIDVLRRSSAKAGRPVEGLEILTPESDFPSIDGRHPLKLALLQF